MLLRGNLARLIILTLIHFTVDFYAGLLVPLPEPTLTEHLGKDLALVALLVGGCAFLVNLIQPISGWLLPKKGMPLLLLLAPLLSALAACIGLSHSVWTVAALLSAAAVGIGIVHPEAALAAHSLSGRRAGLGMSFFMSGGYFGFSFGCLVAGIWAEYFDPTLVWFWVLALPAAVIAGVTVLSGLHRLEGHMKEDKAEGQDRLPILPMLALCVAIAVNISLLIRFLPIFLVRAFPGQGGQGWGGGAVFALGICSAVGAFLWGHLADRFGNARVILAVQLCGAPFLWQLLRITQPVMAVVWAAGIGVTLSGVFPLGVVLARRAHGIPQRLRMGLAIGGAWGSGEVAFILGGKYIGQYPEGLLAPVASVLNLCWVMLVATAMLAAIACVLEKRASSI